MRIAVASIQQETNTFAPGTCHWEDFDVDYGEAAAERMAGTNSELAGAIEAIEEAGGEPVTLLRAWAMPNGPVDHGAFLRLRDDLVSRLEEEGGWDAVVLSLHGAMATTELPDADGVLLEAAREVVGSRVPVVGCLDLHANVTVRMVEAVDALIGYHTDPHVDQASTGRRVARLALSIVVGVVRPRTALAKRPMIVPAEAMDTSTGPLGEVRRLIDAQAGDGVLDVSLFPVQPWLDVPELGFGVLVTADRDLDRARALAERYAQEVWRRREAFRVERLVSPLAAVESARRSASRPFIVAHSADAPTAGAAGDNPAMIEVLARHALDLVSFVPVVDPASVRRCYQAGVGAVLELRVGAGIDRRWGGPVRLEARVVNLGAGSYRLTGVGYTGVELSMGRWAVVSSGGLHVLVTERPAWSADPAAFRHAGLDPAAADVIVVRSCSDFRPNFPAAEAVTLDIRGPATPRVDQLSFERAPRPLWPVDQQFELVT